MHKLYMNQDKIQKIFKKKNKILVQVMEVQEDQQHVSQIVWQLQIILLGDMVLDIIMVFSNKKFKMDIKSNYLIIGQLMEIHGKLKELMFNTMSNLEDILKKKKIKMEKNIVFGYHMMQLLLELMIIHYQVIIPLIVSI